MAQNCLEEPAIQAVAVSVRDITERKRGEFDRLGLERQMLHAQKLESLGVLAGGIAHNFNQVVREMTHLVKVSITKKIQLRFSLEEDLPSVEADGAQIQQVILNLVTNASDAIGDQEGLIRIATYGQELDESYLASTLPGQGLRPGLHTVLEVGDTGVGMKPDVQARIFDPFFTTKPAGHGLGLSAMLGILKGHGGGLTVYSEPGQGTTFKLFFPASSERVAVTMPAPKPTEAAFTGLALLVDDESSIREATGQALELLGFEVETAFDGQDALERFSLRPQAYRIVLMDLTMPRMDGRECFRALRRIRPDLKVILCSGFTEQESIGEFLGKDLAGFLQKPYTLKMLRKTFADVLQVE